MGSVIYSSGMCVECYKEYLENAGGQLQGHNPPAYTQGLIKASKQQVQFSPGDQACLQCAKLHTCARMHQLHAATVCICMLGVYT